MNSQADELKNRMSGLNDETLLKIVEVDYANYRPDALNCAKQELASRGTRFNEPADKPAPSADKKAKTVADDKEEVVIATPQSDIVTIATFGTPYEAQLAKGLLEENGIMACVADEYTVGINWLYSNAVGGVRLQVAEPDAEWALELLEMESQAYAVAPEAPEDQEPEEAWGTCPHCENRNIEYFLSRKGLAIGSILLLGIPLLFPIKKLHCLNCGHVWNYQEGQRSIRWIKVAVIVWLVVIAAVLILSQFFPELFRDEIITPPF